MFCFCCFSLIYNCKFAEINKFSTTLTQISTEKRIHIKTPRREKLCLKFITFWLTTLKILWVVLVANKWSYNHIFIVHCRKIIYGALWWERCCMQWPFQESVDISVMFAEFSFFKIYNDIRQFILRGKFSPNLLVFME